MKKFIKKNIKVIVAFVLGGIILGGGVYATGVFTSSDISFDNTNTHIKKIGTNEYVDNLQDAIDSMYNALENACPTGYELVTLGEYTKVCRSTSAPICRRATTLHTEKCTNTNTSYYCQKDGYALNADITYGKLGTTGASPSVGDAFDCDVNGDGAYDATTERFYYVSDYFDTDSKTFDSTRATLVYYRNFSGGSPSDGGVAYYGGVNENWHGPTTAVAALPNNKASGGSWRNDLLKTQDRKILSCNNPSCTALATTTDNGNHTIDTGNTPVYQGKAARLLHLKELVAGCGTMNWVAGELKSCNFIMERTYYANASGYPTYGSWFENPLASDSAYAWYVNADRRDVGGYSSSITNRGARPVIDVLYSNIEY